MGFQAYLLCFVRLHTWLYDASKVTVRSSVYLLSTSIDVYYKGEIFLCHTDKQIRENILHTEGNSEAIRCKVIYEEVVY
jgi:hypothetical protein